MVTKREKMSCAESPQQVGEQASVAGEAANRSSAVSPPPVRKVYGNLIFYRLPAVADRPFIEKVLRTKNIGRCLFFGAGPDRTALAELTDKEEATAMYQVLRFSTLASPTPWASSSPSFFSTPTTTATPSSSAISADVSFHSSLIAPLSGISTATKRVQDQVEAMSSLSSSTIPLADLYFGHYPSCSSSFLEKSADTIRGKDITGWGVGVKEPTTGALLSSYAYLHFLRFRDHRIHVSWSPIAVEVFYQVGGTVPESRSSEKKESGKKFHVDRSTSPPNYHNMNSGQIDEKKKEVAHASSSPALRPPAKVSRRLGVFPNDCCQRCGSPNHFSRHCPGKQEAGASTSTRTSSSSCSTTIYSSASTSTTFPPVGATSVGVNENKKGGKRCREEQEGNVEVEDESRAEEEMVESEKKEKKQHREDAEKEEWQAGEEEAGGRPRHSTTTATAIKGPAARTTSTCSRNRTHNCNPSASSSSSSATSYGEKQNEKKYAGGQGYSTATKTTASTGAAVPSTVGNKDQCKHCGSTEHFSRHCPKK